MLGTSLELDELLQESARDGSLVLSGCYAPHDDFILSLIMVPEDSKVYS